MKFLISVLALFFTSYNEMSYADSNIDRPLLVLEDYFIGETQAWGLFEDRFGNLRRQFEVEILGEMDGTTLVLTEDFRYADGETETRIWRIERDTDGAYLGASKSLVGLARGTVSGNSVHWIYDAKLKVGRLNWRVRFDDRMYLQTGNILLNRATVSKLGIELGEVTLVFSKPSVAFDLEVREMAKAG